MIITFIKFITALADISLILKSTNHVSCIRQDIKIEMNYALLK